MVSEGNGLAPTQEMETFLPQDVKGKIVTTTYNMTKDTKDVETADYDPFADRKLDNPTSNNDTLTHLLKASLGSGILAMPYAFKSSGLILGIFFTILASVVCTHCSYILIKCAHVLYSKTKKTKMSFSEVGEAALANGPQWARKWAYSFKIFILVSLFATYFGTCSVYTVIIADNLLKVINVYLKDESKITTQLIIIILLVPIILMVWIRNLKYLAPVSMLANVLMAVGLGITFYYLVGTAKLDFSKVQLWKGPVEWPEFFSITVFAMEAIGVVMPLENAMKTPRSLLGYCGVLNKGMSGVTLVYMILGFLGYLRYGEDVGDAITLSLAEKEIPAQIVMICIAVAVYCTFGLQFFVCVDIMWNGIKHKFTKRPDLADYVMRTIMATLCVLLAAAVPQIAPFISVIGAFFFSLLGLMAPAIIEIITFWDIGFGRGNYLIWKNVLVFIFGTLSLIFGTRGAILKIIQKL